MRRVLPFLRSDQGSILPFFGMTLVIVMGILALGFDIGRMASTQAELQSFADNVALAAAGELDGADDSLDRATAAAEALIADSASFGVEDDLLSGPEDYALSFLSAAPAPGQAVADLVTEDPVAARFVHVAVTPQDVQPWFAAAFATLSGQPALSGRVAAEAVASFSLMACDITPLMFCIPSPDFRADENIGVAVKLRAGGQGTAWGPGDFGFLDPSVGLVDEDGPCHGLTGQRLDGCLVAAEGPRLGCFDQRGVSVRPGQAVGSAEAALNVLFDIYAATMNAERRDPNYPPAPGVVSGYVPAKGACIGNSPALSPDSKGLPPDDCFATGACARFGSGLWSAGRGAYVAANYGATDPHPAALTRYDYYKAELDAAGGAASTTPILTGRAETGRPKCSLYQSDDPARRVVTAAAIDCAAHPIQGSIDNVPVSEFVEVFLLRPLGLDGTRDVWVEIVGGVGGGTDGNESDSIVRDVVRLVR